MDGVSTTQSSVYNEIKRTPTSKLCLEDIRHNPSDAGMICIASAIQRGLSDLLSDSGDKPIKEIEVLWINKPDRIENPLGRIGFFQLIGKR